MPLQNPNWATTDGNSLSVVGSMRYVLKLGASPMRTGHRQGSAVPLLSRAARQNELLRTVGEFAASEGQEGGPNLVEAYVKPLRGRFSGGLRLWAVLMNQVAHQAAQRRVVR